METMISKTPEQDLCVQMNLLKLTMAIITIVVSVPLAVRSDAIIDLLKDFAALMVISQFW